MDHSPCNMATIRPPYSGIYESLIRRYVGAWESLKNEYFLRRSREAQGWAYYQDIGAKYERHLQHSVTMLGECVYRGDDTASIWINDVFLKWISELEYYIDPGLHFSQKDKWVTFDLMEQDWDAVEAQLDIHVDLLGYGNLKKSVFSVALQNYWTDACCIFSYQMVIWGRDCDCRIPFRRNYLDL